MNKNEYKCEACKGIFTKGWTDKEAEVEYRKNFKSEYLAKVETESVCDDCYKTIRGYYAPWANKSGQIE